MHQVMDPGQHLPSLSERQGLVSRVIGNLKSPQTPGRLHHRFTVTLQTRMRLGGFAITFVLCVVFPAVAAVYYFACVASDEYVSEAKFAVRSSESTPAISDAISSNPSGAKFQSGHPVSQPQEPYIVADYIRGRSIIEDIGGRSALHTIYSKIDIDWFSRLEKSASLEEIWKYWNRKIIATVDTLSGVINVNVRAFNAIEAQRLAQSIVARSEHLINEMSDRIRHDALQRAEAEVEIAQERLAKARSALVEFRNQENLINPTESATSIGETITKLMHDKITLENQKSSMRGIIASDSPTMRVTAAQISALDEQIRNLREKLTSQTQEGVISAQIATFESLQLEVQFAEKLYSIAQSGYETARISQHKQQLYLVEIVRPTRAESASYPRIFIDSAAVFAVCLILWSMGALVFASVRDHMD